MEDQSRAFSPTFRGVPLEYVAQMDAGGGDLELPEDAGRLTFLSRDAIACGVASGSLEPADREGVYRWVRPEGEDGESEG